MRTACIYITRGGWESQVCATFRIESTYPTVQVELVEIDAEDLTDEEAHALVEKCRESAIQELEEAGERWDGQG